jgi:hypothetical protein
LTEKQSESSSDIFPGASASTRKLFASGASASASTSLIESPIPYASDCTSSFGTMFTYFIFDIYTIEIGVRHWVSKGVADGRRPPVL